MCIVHCSHSPIRLTTHPPSFGRPNQSRHTHNKERRRVAAAFLFPHWKLTYQMHFVCEWTATIRTRHYSILFLLSDYFFVLRCFTPSNVCHRHRSDIFPFEINNITIKRNRGISFNSHFQCLLFESVQRRYTNSIKAIKLVNACTCYSPQPSI